jgi:hypothetical protein
VFVAGGILVIDTILSSDQIEYIEILDGCESGASLDSYSTSRLESAREYYESEGIYSNVLDIELEYREKINDVRANIDIKKYDTAQRSTDQIIYFDIFNKCVSGESLHEYSDSQLNSAYEYYELKNIYLGVLNDEIEYRNSMQYLHKSYYNESLNSRDKKGLKT